MNVPILNSQESSNLVEQDDHSEQTDPSADPTSEEANRYSDQSVQHLQPITEETTPAATEPDEVLVADARGGLTPGQMVEQKLMTLMGGNFPGLISQATGRRGNIRRIPIK